MNIFTEAFLDRWEARATKKGKRWEKETPPKWVLVISPDLRLLPTARYTFRLYVRQNLQIVLLITVYFILWLFPLAFLWYKYPFILHGPRYHKLLIGILSHSGFYIFPWIILSLLAFNCLLYLPRAYFWNRRAERLRREPPVSEAPGEATVIDAGVWPPPPQRPAI